MTGPVCSLIPQLCEGNCRSKSPGSFVTSEPWVNTSHSCTYVYENYGTECSGQVIAVELFAKRNNDSVVWNNTLSLNLLFLEADREQKVYKLKATIPVSVGANELSAKLLDPIQLSGTQIPSDVTITPAYSTVGFELPAAKMSDNNTMVYNHIPLLNIMDVGKCHSTANITTGSGPTRLFCPPTSPPLIITVKESRTDGSTSTYTRDYTVYENVRVK